MSQHTGPSARISSGNARLDMMCGGGFYRDSIILVSGPTGTGKTLIVATFLNEGCRRREKALLFAFQESRSQLLRNAAGWGIDFAKWEEMGLLRVVCRHSQPTGLEDLVAAMKEEIEAFGPVRIAVDNLSATEGVSATEGFRDFVRGLASHITTKGITALFTATTPSLTGGTSIAEAQLWTVADTILLLRYVELMGEIRRGLAVLKMGGSWHDNAIREYKIDDTGMNLSTAFHEVKGILAGTPARCPFTQEQWAGVTSRDEIHGPHPQRNP